MAFPVGAVCGRDVGQPVTGGARGSARALARRAPQGAKAELPVRSRWSVPRALAPAPPSAPPVTSPAGVATSGRPSVGTRPGAGFVVSMRLSPRRGRAGAGRGSPVRPLHVARAARRPGTGRATDADGPAGYLRAPWPSAGAAYRDHPPAGKTLPDSLGLVRTVASRVMPLSWIDHPGRTRGQFGPGTAFVGPSTGPVTGCRRTLAASLGREHHGPAGLAFRQGHDASLCLPVVVRLISRCRRRWRCPGPRSSLC
jgi:hypothetical protein